MGQRRLAQHFDVAKSTIRKRLAKLGRPSAICGKPDSSPARYWIHSNDAELTELSKRIGQRKLADHFNVSHSTIRDALIYLGLPTKSPLLISQEQTILLGQIKNGVYDPDIQVSSINSIATRLSSPQVPMWVIRYALKQRKQRLKDENANA